MTITTRSGLLEIAKITVAAVGGLVLLVPFQYAAAMVLESHLNEHNLAWAELWGSYSLMRTRELVSLHFLSWVIPAFQVAIGIFWMIRVRVIGGRLARERRRVSS